MAKKTPLRKCIGCGEMIPKKEMLRIVKNKENNIKFDHTGRENGRGAYIHLMWSVLIKLLSQRVWNDLLKCPLIRMFMIG